MGSSTLGQGRMPPQKVGISGTQHHVSQWEMGRDGAGSQRDEGEDQVEQGARLLRAGHQKDQSCLSPSGRVDQLGRGSAAQRPSLSLHGIILPVMSHKRPPSP